MSGEIITILGVGVVLAAIIALWFVKQRNLLAVDWGPNRVSRIRSSADNSSSVNYSRPDPPSNVVIREHVPYPYVYYPGKYGSFCAFAEHEGGDPVLCLCSFPAITNLRKLQESCPAHKIFDLSDAVFSSNRQPLPDFSYSRFLPTASPDPSKGRRPLSLSWISNLGFVTGVIFRCQPFSTAIGILQVDLLVVMGGMSTRSISHLAFSR